MIVHLRANTLVVSAILCSVWWVFLVQPTVRGAGRDQPQLIIAAEPQGEATELKYKLESPELTVFFFIRNTGEVEAKDLRLSARLHETNRAHGSTVLQLSSDGKQLDDGTLALKPDESIGVELKVKGLPVGTSSGYLLVEQGNDQFTLAPLDFEYYVAPEVKVVGLPDGSELQGTTHDGTYEYIFSIQSQNDTPIEELRATVTRVTGPDGAQHTATVEVVPPGKMPIALDGHSIVDLRLKTELPLAGTYKGTMNLSYDSHIKEVPFSISRTKMPLPYEILPPEAVRTDVCFGQDDTRIRVTLHELNGLPIKSGVLPELTMLNAAVTGQKTYQTKFKGASWQDDAGQSVSALNLAPGESRALWLVVSGLAAAGEHVGSLRLSLPDGQAVTQSISIIARKHIGFVIFFIALGIALSQVLRLLGSQSVNIQEQQQLSQLDAKAVQLALLPELDAEGRSIIDQLRARIAIVFADSQANRGQSYAAQISELDRKLCMTPRWSAVAAAARAVRPPQADLLSQVEQIKQLLRAENSSVEELGSSEKSLDKLVTDVGEKHRQLLVAAIDDLSQQLGRYRELQALSDEATQRLGKVNALVAAARDSVARNLDSAQQLYDEASREYALSLVTDLQEQIKRPPAVFTGEISDARWNEIEAQLSRQLDQAAQLVHADPNAALRLTWRLRATYWQRSLHQAIACVQSKIQPKQDPPQPDLDELKARLEAMKGFAAELAQLDSAPEISPEALLAFERKIESCGESLTEAPDQVGVLEGISGATRLLAGLQAVRFPLGLGRREVRLSDGKALRSRRWWNEFWIIALSGIVAVVLGLKLLWIDNIIWGTTGDFLIAVLWGLGLHQVANASFDFNSFRSRLTRRPGQEAAAPG